MPEINDGDTVEVQGSGAKPYALRNVGGVYSCSCPAWRNQSIAIERRTCKHLRRHRGEAAEQQRVGAATTAGSAAPAAAAKKSEDPDVDAGPPVMLAEAWNGVADLTGWWMSEKLDGVRGYWDGTQFLSRLGNTLHAPDWFVAGLPAIPLDGELWMARRAFQRTVSVVRRQDKSDHWKQICFLVFDAPGPGPFEERQKIVETHLSGSGTPQARPHPHRVCSGLEDLKSELARVEQQGGEGLMLRRPGSPYEAGRSSSLLKVKTFKDGEAVVIGHQAGAGRHKGRLGALLVQMADGTRFSVGTGYSDAERTAPPAIGQVIRFRYQELSDGGVPRFPSYVGLRDDVRIEIAPPAAESPTPLAQSAPPAPPAPKAPPAPRDPAVDDPTTPPPPSGARHFEFIGGSSRKFWEVSVDGANLVVRYGRIGSAGQSRTKPCADPAAARAQADRLIAEKLAEGYSESR